MNKKGFTLVELITTFALASVIIILLINIIVVIKNIYSKTDLKTELFIHQGNLSNAMNKVINKDNLISYSECNDAEFCYVFNISTGESFKLTIADDVIKFGNYVYKLKSNTSVNNPSITTEHITGITNNKDSFLIIKIPIVSTQYPNEDFGINLIYPYDSSETNL